MEHFKYLPEIASAWKILLDCGINSFPVPVKRVAKSLNIPVLRYSAGESILKELKLYDAAMWSDAITVPLGTGCVIMYDDSIKNPRARIAIGHELGHILLGHVKPGTATAVNHPPAKSDDRVEFEANLFCEQLIASTGVLLAAGITTRSKIERICKVNRRASDFILARLSERPDYEPTHPADIELVRRFMRSI